MNEGWLNDEYVCLFSNEESAAYSARCNFEFLLPGFELVGLLGWHDFIVVDRNGAVFSLPTVPILARNLASFELPTTLALEPDSRFKGMIKWYVKPLIFGGDVDDTENVKWIRPEQHAQLVAWWNEQYRALVA